MTYASLLLGIVDVASAIELYDSVLYSSIWLSARVVAVPSMLAWPRETMLRA